MKTGSLLQALSKLSDLLAASGAKKDASEIKEFGSLLESHKDRPLDETLDDIKGALTGDQNLLAEKYVEELTAAGSNVDAFEAVYDAMFNNKALSKEQLALIAKNYSRKGKSSASKREAFETIRKRFIELAYNKDRMEIVKSYKTG